MTMAHKQQAEFVASVKSKFPSYFNNVDVAAGKGVDVVSKAHLYTPAKAPNTVISTEMLEHDMYYEKSLAHFVDILTPGGLLVITCATTGRAEHGTSRSSPHASGTTQYDTWCDYYKNLTADDFTKVIDLNRIFSSFEFSTNTKTHDLYFYGIKVEK